MKKQSDSTGEIPHQKVKTRLEVAEEYGISVRTLTRRLKKCNVHLPNGSIFPNEVEEIYKCLGGPASRKGFTSELKE